MEKKSEPSQNFNVSIALFPVKKFLCLNNEMVMCLLSLGRHTRDKNLD